MEKLNNIPSLRFPEFIGNLEKKKFGEEIQESGYGPRFNGDDYNIDGNVRTIRGTDISLDGEILYNQVPIASLDVNFIKNHILDDGDLVMITTADCGLTGVFRKQNMDFIPSAYAVKLKLKNTSNPNYFKFYFQTVIAKNQVDKFIRKATVANLPGSDILKLSIYIPALPEQTKIASFLTVVDERLNQLKQKKLLLEQYKKGVMQKIFDQEIRFKDDEGNVFPDWEVTKFGSLYSFKATNSYSRDNLNYESGEVKNIHYGDIHTKFKPRLDTGNEYIPYINKEIDISKIPNENYCNEGDLVIADASEDYNDIGKAIEIYNLNNDKVVAGLHTILAKPDLSKIALGFGANLMKAEYIHFQIRVISQGTKVLGLSSNRLSDISVKLPCVNEQAKIANFLTAIDEKISLCDSQIAKTVKYKKGLLQQMFV